MSASNDLSENMFDSYITSYIKSNDNLSGITHIENINYNSIISMIKEMSLEAYCETSDYFLTLMEAIDNKTEAKTEAGSCNLRSLQPQDRGGRSGKAGPSRTEFYELFVLTVYIKRSIMIKTERGRKIATNFLVNCLDTFCLARFGGLTDRTIDFISEIAKRSDDEIFMMSPCQEPQRIKKSNKKTPLL
jgi:hypothetical protein